VELVSFICVIDLIHQKISASSNLASEKLMCLSSSLNKILQSIVDIYNSCDDTHMHIQEKYKKIADTRFLDKDILMVCVACFLFLKNNTLRAVLGEYESLFLELVVKHKK
jgi:hypothetical protein